MRKIAIIASLAMAIVPATFAKDLHLASRGSKATAKVSYKAGKHAAKGLYKAGKQLF